MRFYNKIIRGIILIVLGICVTGFSDYTYTKSQTVLEQCKSISGFREFLSPTECNTASILFSITMMGSLIRIIITIVGLISLIVGIVKRKKSKVISRSRNPILPEEIINDQSKDQEIESNIFSENNINDDITHTDENIPPKHYEWGYSKDH